jgi:hypothetical protein
LKNKVEEHVRRQKETVPEQEASYRNQEKGKVTIKKNRNNSSSGQSGDSGDYVDYEEIKD